VLRLIIAQDYCW